MRRRPVVMIRAATLSRRSRLGSQLRARVVGPGQQLCPGHQFVAQGGQLEPDLVLAERLQRQVGQAGVFESADAVLGASTHPMAYLKVSKTATGGVGGEQGDAPAMGIGDAQLGTGMGPLPAGDHRHPGRLADEGRR